MAGVYLDTRARTRGARRARQRGDRRCADRLDAIVSSRLLRIELHRVGLRTGVAREELETRLAGLSLVPTNDAILSAAEAVSPSSVATLDAIDLATALQLAADGHVASIMTSEVRLAEGAREHGLAVIAPS